MIAEKCTHGAGKTAPALLYKEGGSLMSEPCAPLANTGRRSCLIPIRLICPNPDQPRRHFDEMRLMELAASISQHGLLQPVTVREKQSGFELVMGERRLRACKMLGMKYIDAFVLSPDAGDGAILALVENLQREELHFLEEAEAYLAVLETGVTQENLARRLGKSVSSVANKVRLLQLEQPVRKVILDEALTERHARALLRLPKGDVRLRIAQDAADRHLTVRETEERIKKELRVLPQSSAPRRVISLAGDPRLYVNAIRSVVDKIRLMGVDAVLCVDDGEEKVTITVTLPRRCR